MRFEHSGLAKMLAALIPFALALGVAGCSGDSGTAAEGNSGDSERSATEKGSNGKGSSGESASTVKTGECNFKKDDKVWVYAYSGTMAGDSYESFEFVFFDGKNTKDSIYSVIKGPTTTEECKEMKGKKTEQTDFLGTKTDYTFWCDDGVMYATEVSTPGSLYDLSRKEAFDMVMGFCMENNGIAKSSSSSAPRSSSSTGRKSSSSTGGKSSSSNGDKSSSSGKDGGSSAGTYNGMTAGCNFKKGDKVWKFYLKDNTAGVEYKSYYYEYKEGGSIDSTHTVSEGSLAKQLCSLTGPEEDTYTSDGQTYHEKYWCTDKGSEEFKSIRGVDPDYDRDEAFSEFMSKCRRFNGLPSEPDDEDEDLSSSSEAEEAESSSSAEEAKSSSSSGDSASGSTCDFEKDDDVWVMDIVGVGLTTLTWSGNSYTAVSEISVNLENETICEQSVENADPEDHAYCEGSVYKSRAERVVDDADRDEVYEASMAACAL